MSYDRSRGPPNIQGMTSLKVDNLTYRTTVDDLKRVFREYGEVGDIYIPRDARTNQSRGFAFVRFFERRDAEDAMDRVDGSVLDGREIRVQHAKYGRPSSSDYRQRSRGDRHFDRSRGRRSYSPRHRRSRSRSFSPRKRSRSPRRRRSRSRSHSPRRRQSPSPRRDRQHASRSPSPKQASESPERNGSPVRNKSKSSSPERD